MKRKECDVMCLVNGRQLLRRVSELSLLRQAR